MQALTRMRKIRKNVFFILVFYKIPGNLLTYRNSLEVKMAQGRCMKCKKTVEIKNGQEIVMKNGMKAIKGVCPVCGTKVFRILGKAK